MGNFLASARVHPIWCQRSANEAILRFFAVSLRLTELLTTIVTITINNYNIYVMYSVF